MDKQQIKDEQTTIPIFQFPKREYDQEEEDEPSRLTSAPIELDMEDRLLDAEDRLVQHLHERELEAARRQLEELKIRIEK